MAHGVAQSFAIVGFSFKMPGEAVDEAGFWEVLESRKNLMTEWPESRANVDSFHDNGSKLLNTVSCIVQSSLHLCPAFNVF